MVEQLSLALSKNGQGPRILYFDLETLRSAEEVGGWEQTKKMGMACGVCFDAQDEQFHCYDELSAPALIDHLRKADLVVGFNHIRFDYGVLSSYTTFDLKKLPSFDILEDITKILGHRLKLDSLARSTLGETKSANGYQSLAWVREGRMDLVRKYCKKDVDVTKNLFLFGAREGHVTFEKNGNVIKVPVAWDPHKLIERIKQSH